jgi:hypothetical protein
VRILRPYFANVGKRLVKTPKVYFTDTGILTEVDFVVDTGSFLVPIEAKTSATPRPAMAAGFVTLRELLGAKAAPGYVVHAGEVRLPLAPGVTALPIVEI